MLRSAIVSILVVSATHADERTFAVSVDGKQIGEFAVNTRLDAGEMEISSKINIDGKSLYSSNCVITEHWKDGRLIRLEVTGEENQKKGGVTLISGKGGYALKAGAKETAVRGDVWPTTFFIRLHADRPLIIDVLTGDVAQGKSEKIGPDHLVVDGQQIPVTRYQLTAGTVATELSYDRTDRLVRRKWERNGHAIAIELTHIKRD